MEVQSSDIDHKRPVRKHGQVTCIFGDSSVPNPTETMHHTELHPMQRIVIDVWRFSSTIVNHLLDDFRLATTLLLLRMWVLAEMQRRCYLPTETFLASAPGA